MGINNILAIDASTAILSLALKTEEGTFQYNADKGLRHSELLMPAVDYLFGEANLTRKDLDLVCTALGPGSFTGLRVAMSAAKGIAAGTGAEFVAVPTLDTLAEPFSFFSGIVLPLIDARKKRYYTAFYSQGKRLTDYADWTPEKIISRLAEEEGTPPLLFTGPDSPAFKEQGDILAVRGYECHYDSQCRRGNSLVLMKQGQELFEKRGADSMDTGPLYMRKSEAELSLEAKKFRQASN